MRHTRPTTYSPAASRNPCVKRCQPRPTRQRRKGCLTRTRPEIVQAGNDTILNLAHPRGAECPGTPVYGEGAKSKLGVGVAACHSVVPGVARRLMQRSSEVPNVDGARQPCPPGPALCSRPLETLTETVRPGRVRPGARHGSYEKPGAGTCMQRQPARGASSQSIPGRADSGPQDVARGHTRQTDPPCSQRSVRKAHLGERDNHVLRTPRGDAGCHWTRRACLRQDRRIT